MKNCMTKVRNEDTLTFVPFLPLPTHLRNL